jgi:predicted transcriptional regulator
MAQLVIELSPELEGALEALAAAQHKTVAQVAVEQLHTLVGRRGSPKEVLAGMRAAPKVSREDVQELQRLIREAKTPAPERGIFD